MKKYYKLILGGGLILLWIGYIVLWDTTISSKSIAGTDTDIEETEYYPNPAAKDTPTPTPAVTEEPASTEAPEDVEETLPTEAEASPEPTATPTPTATATPTPTPEPTATPTPTEVPVAAEPYKADFVIANVSTSLNIRGTASADGTLLGSLGADAWATLLEKGDEWSKIKSGGITGYALTKYLLFDQTAINRAKQLDALYIEVSVDTLNLRSEKNTTSTIIKEMKKGEKLKLLPDKSDAEWVAVQLDASTTGYMKAEYVKVALTLSQALPITQ